ncbi:hypothetical protein BJI69_14180 [Luteibacter rhizovicinus DSM 16549]|uniref:Uncharacterized protein n=1 Tax=Luteibacter rhizovicinus DSM 16549 TaxID=1440763 RepID=A0A0G9HG47_9GAMM|nr:hypothetical protein [Luteibacter rhizovicinus]APG04925.1 hypothetical protein BJI69_14180 [Luteibacter rhizovicinus DSM 16549]KLD68471.1 hypothetical protein Y883_01985 [Luteibacter rhizovicinus DSM 16549]KLD70679.1 hypothetical protein Y886_42565 [Xanthomonas hyacinthi DSM 19077]
MSKTPSRIYIVTRKDATNPRLVRATSQPQALRHVALDEYNVDIPTQDELISATTSGVTVEIATTPDV